MIRQRTVFVLGAGASVPYGFPTGAELRDTVIKNLRWNDAVWTPILSELDFNQGEVEQFNDALRQSARPSVDSFVEHRPEFMRLGKAAIALALIPKEVPEVVFPKTPHDDWYQYLFGRMDTSFERFGQNEVAFVTFNYDRSLEFFLTTALTNAFGRSVGDVRKVLESIPIIHVHGRLGALADETDSSGPARGYDNKLNTLAVQRSLEGLVIMPEAEEDSPAFEEARAQLASARRIFFLGFGYHVSNMTRLRLGEYEGRLAGGTSLGLGLAEREDIQGRWKIPLYARKDWATDLDTLGFLKNAAHLA